VLVGENERDLRIAVDKAALRQPTNNVSEPANDLAFIDALVALGNRRAFDMSISELLVAAGVAQEPLALLRIDIDNFKAVNDQHGGHAVGDEALVAIARILESSVRGKGTAYRISGDEFAMLLPNHTVNEALAVGERARRSVNEQPLTSRSLNISVSIGVAVQPDHGTHPASLSQAADTACYDAKQLGRNLVRIYGEPPPATANGERHVDRKQPEPGGLSDQQRTKIRTDYFRDRLARCPFDEAILDVQDVTAQQDSRNQILVSCPLCGISEHLR
jgi:diguanylate cyclase (GGDEF)-like protein